MGVEVKAGAHSIRDLRDGLLHLAGWLVDQPTKRGLLVLVNSRISESRLSAELESARGALHPGIVDRLTVAVLRDGEYSGLPETSGGEFRRWLDALVETSESRFRVPRMAHHEVLQVLVHEWLLGRGPVQVGLLGKIVGCSAPTVAAALKRIGPHIRRTSDRRVELRYFPRDDWNRLLAVADEVRGTMRFADRSGQPRTPETLLRRLGDLEREDVGVGGVMGSRHYHPGLDLVGASRLDLTWHCRTRPEVPDFVKRMDAALEPVSAPGEPASLVVHVLRRAEPMFQEAESGLPWADPVECLLDLQEARLHSQAMEFISHFERKYRKRS